VDFKSAGKATLLLKSNSQVTNYCMGIQTFKSYSSTGLEALFNSRGYDISIKKKKKMQKSASCEPFKVRAVPDVRDPSGGRTFYHPLDGSWQLRAQCAQVTCLPPSFPLHPTSLQRWCYKLFLL
jgi:hypothetical protein